MAIHPGRHGSERDRSGELRADAALLARPGNAEIQLDLFLDYRTNFDLYPQFQEYFRARRPPLLAVWGGMI